MGGNISISVRGRMFLFWTPSSPMLGTALAAPPLKDRPTVLFAALGRSPWPSASASPSSLWASGKPWFSPVPILPPVQHILVTFVAVCPAPPESLGCSGCVSRSRRVDSYSGIGRFWTQVDRWGRWTRAEATLARLSWARSEDGEVPATVELTPLPPLGLRSRGRETCCATREPHGYFTGEDARFVGLQSLHGQSPDRFHVGPVPLPPSTPVRARMCPAGQCTPVHVSKASDCGLNEATKTRAESHPLPRSLRPLRLLSSILTNGPSLLVWLAPTPAGLPTPAGPMEHLVQPPSVRTRPSRRALGSTTLWALLGPGRDTGRLRRVQIRRDFTGHPGKMVGSECELIRPFPRNNTSTT